MVVVNNLQDQNSPYEWFRSLPIVTRYWFGATAGLTLLGNFGVINPMQFIFAWPHIRTRLELWRLLTSFCYAGPFAFDTLITVYMVYTISVRYETNTPFNTGAGGGTADYVFAMLLAMTLILVTYPFVSIMFPMPPIFTKNLLYFVMYVWSKRNPTAQANIWGIPLQAIWLPFAYLALTVFTGNPYFGLLHGLAIGHLYYFLVDVFPQVYGRDILVTPAFLIDKLGVGDYRPDQAPLRDDPANTAPTAEGRGGGGGAAAAQQEGHNWGARGQRLGR